MSRMNLADLLLAAARVPKALGRRGRERRHRKLMRTAPRFSLADMPENTFGKVVGRVRPERKRLLEAPLSGRLCVYYEVEIDAMIGETMLRTLAGEQEGITFVVEDGDARARVDPAHAFMSTGIDHVRRSNLKLMSEREEALLRRLHLDGRKVQFADGLRYREAILEAEERIAVFGGGVREPDADAETDGLYRDSAPTRLCFTGTSTFPLFISDDPRAL